MNCPHCNQEINPGALLGSMAKGKGKTLTQAEKGNRADRLAEARKKRWPKGELI